MAGMTWGGPVEAGEEPKKERLTGTLHLPKKPVTGNTQRLRKNSGKEQQNKTS
jgi:hypothetical protein